MEEPKLSAETSGQSPPTSFATQILHRAEGLTRRDILREGLKVAFVAPVVTTFFARDALAAGSNHSCYPALHECEQNGSSAEPCCDGLTCQLSHIDVDTLEQTWTCQP